MDGGRMDDRADQDPMVPSSRAIVIPGLLSQRRYVDWNATYYYPYGYHGFVQSCVLVLKIFPTMLRKACIGLTCLAVDVAPGSLPTTRNKARV
ncbi:hypothetical protein IEQ34_018187 [Dendrobium chrysotoxum]|uniref:Uncharacterized protein n=1 Tax=Dendrobium chrysotoxum TaxID=161865 RepID=A0AAV7GDT9_DENCH|nr:hypothetical protein IEQ34_018187 [Dendrobium chrysotoxum]